MSAITIQFGEPEHGWMAIRFGGLEWHTVSDVPCDSIRYLTGALSRLLDGSTLECIDWSLEPDYAQWVFRRDGDNLSFLVKDNGRAESTMRFSGATPKLIAPFVDALTALEGSEIWKRDEGEFKIWSWPFPSAKLEQLRIKLAEQTTDTG